ncbi:magnesium chelatase [Candidatus Nomurabacteria bacterium RIFCSPLOWO2_01_FULL_33_24]|uniref:Magnesium chelatase n=1 Tax=Candidatus Nomurabacteria bacterium RIFCSPLOWO2_01_FULL_33_24 TaxID=1801765 RepID=A0A1F6WZG3_9BACT|nr:MAG: magnesium chelatase [Candidatus Nomurabacteria bacterium RIFCSPLOWO2_01_FULL_33_24]
MAFSRVYSAQTNLLKGQIITIETDLSRGLHSFNIVGLPDKAVEESKDRVSSAIKNSGYKSPKSTNQKIIVSLAPADFKKEGPFFDLAVALGYLLSSGEINFAPEKKIFLGELSLNGELQSIRGALPLVEEAKNNGFEEIFLPKQNTKEAALIDGVKIFGASNLKEVINHLNLKQETDINKNFKLSPEEKTIIKKGIKKYNIDFSDIRGQEGAKRGLEIAAAGGHNIAMTGPAGTGKTMLARVFSQILPELDNNEILEITSIHSIAGTLKDNLLTEPPFRAPHHTASHVSIVGGGVYPKPGEITLAHRGVLFLDEFPEFEKRVIESLRQPLEDNIVNISRAKGSAVFPSNFILIAAMNPCPCGNLGSENKECICRPSDLARYQRKLSGPIMDRIDIWVQVGNVDYQKLGGESSGEKTRTIKKRVAGARQRQEKRFKKFRRNIKNNSAMNVKDITKITPLGIEVRELLNQSAEKLSLSARAYHRVIKLARTIADLEESEEIKTSHLLEALQYRPR